MTGESGTTPATPTDSDEEVDRLLNDPAAREWMDKHRIELQRLASGPTLMYQMLAIGIALGLAAQIAGYLLKTVATTEPLGLAVDLLYTLGLALWTGAIVVLFVQVLPEAKRRQIERALQALESRQVEGRGTKRGDRGHPSGVRDPGRRDPGGDIDTDPLRPRDIP